MTRHITVMTAMLGEGGLDASFLIFLKCYMISALQYTVFIALYNSVYKEKAMVRGLRISDWTARAAQVRKLHCQQPRSVPSTKW